MLVVSWSTSMVGLHVQAARAEPTAGSACAGSKSSANCRLFLLPVAASPGLQAYRACRRTGLTMPKVSLP